MNQDTFREWSAEHICVAVVCDGMGGMNSGEVASELAADTFMSELRAFADEATAPHEAAQYSAPMVNAVLRAGAVIYERGATDPECDGMGTTLVAAAVAGYRACVANIGDSRAYHITERGIKRVTRDHSVVEEMVERGEITREQARVHPSRNLITRALGSVRGERPDIFEVDLARGDGLLLCTDGLTNVLTDAEICSVVRSALSAEFAVRSLIDTTIERGAPDNVTAVLMVTQ
jgi:protein phosphatase